MIISIMTWGIRAIIVKKKYIVAIIIVIGLLIGLFAAVEFSILEQGSRQPQLIPINGSENVNRERISLENTIVVFNSHDSGGMNQNGNYTIHYIHGEDIDFSGNAKTWVLAININQSQFYFEYQDQNSKVYAWNETNISTPILVDKLIMPDRLFALHNSFITDILGDPGVTRKEIQLENGIYTLTVTKNVPKEYLFNAYSGEIISA